MWAFVTNTLMGSALLASIASIGAVGAAHALARPHDRPLASAVFEAVALAFLIAACLQAATSPSDQLAALALLICLGFLAAFDIRRLAVPVVPIMLGIAAGLLDAALIGRDALLARGVAAVAGWAAFQAISVGYRTLRGREGLGAGDALVAALIGSWLSFEGLAWSVALGGMMLAVWALARQHAQNAPMPFVPGLALGAALVLITRPWIEAFAWAS